MTTEEFRIIEENMRRARESDGIAPQQANATKPHNAKQSPKRGMNKWESMYEQNLIAHMAVGAILWYKFEALRFRLADGAYYKPDFIAMMRDGSFDVYEVKGMWREAARVRIKVAADQHPFRFVAVSKRLVKDGGGWSEELFTAALDRLKR